MELLVVRSPGRPREGEAGQLGVVERGWSVGEIDAERFASFDDAHAFEQVERELRSDPAKEARSRVG